MAEGVITFLFLFILSDLTFQCPSVRDGLDLGDVLSESPLVHILNGINTGTCELKVAS